MTSGRTLASFSAARHHAGEFAIDDQRFRFAVVEHEGERRRVEAGVERVEHRPAHRHAIVAFEHRRRVGEHDGDGVAAREAALRQRRGERLRTRVKLAIVAPKRPMDDRRAGPGRPRRRARERRAASAAGNWRGCDRDRDRRATGTSGSSGSDRRHHTVRSGLWGGDSGSHGRKAKDRKPTKVTIIATPTPAATKSGRIAGVTATPKRGASRTQAE